jgi:hypothetical protein
MRKVLVSIAAIGAVAGSLTAATAQDRRPRASLAPELIAAASAFETYARTTAEISPGFQDGDAVADALKVGAGYEPKQLQAGMTAYAALAALRETPFVESVRRAAREEGAANVARRMHERPDLALYFPGAESAAARAAAALAVQADALRTDGAQVKQAAYDVQRQPWSKAPVADPARRLSRIKQISTAGFTPGEDDADKLIQALTTDVPLRPAAASPVVQRALALAALAVLDRTGGDDAQAALALAHEPNAGNCVRLAKLNLFQCLAVAGPHYEDVFCLGEHAMLEPAKCVSKAAGLAPTMAAASPQALP